MENKNFIITINREFGTGGREIAKELANLLGVKVYDKALLDAALNELNITREELEKATSDNSNWWDGFLGLYKKFGNQSAVDQKEHVTTKTIYAAEKKLMIDIAQRESCVIVGRTAFAIFKNHPNAVKILLIADDEARVKRVMETEDLSLTEARRFVKNIDGERDKYIEKFAGVSRYDARNYDFVLNVTGIPTHLVAVFLAQNIRLKFKDII